MAEQTGPATAGGPAARPGGLSTGGGGFSATGAPQDPAAQERVDQAGQHPGAPVVPFVSQVPGTPVHFPHYSGRTSSWVAVTIIMAAVLVGGLALTIGSGIIWWLFWAAAAVALLGFLLCAALRVFDDWY